MNRLLRPLLAGCLITATSVPFLSACADNEVSLYIRGVPAPTPPDCNVTNDPSAIAINVGFVDVAFSKGLSMDVLVGNQLTPRGDKLNARAESTRITLDRAEIRLVNSANEQFECASDENCGSFSVFGSGFVDPSSGADPGYGLFSVTMIPPALAEELRSRLPWGTGTTVVAGIRVSGRTLGGQDVESGEFIFTIETCNGCRIKYNAGGGQCCDKNLPVPETTVTGNVCLGDTPVNCNDPQACQGSVCNYAPGMTDDDEDGICALIDGNDNNPSVGVPNPDSNP